MAKKLLIIFDRDGVINVLRKDYVKRLEDFKFIFGAEKSLNMLAIAGKKIAICSNQRGVALGKINEATLNIIDRKIKNCFHNDFNRFKTYYCKHGHGDNCNCRKPNDGLLTSAIQDAGVKRSNTIFVGDSVSDFLAAQKANIDFSLVLTGNGIIANKEIPKKIPRYKNINYFVKAITSSHLLN